MRRSTGLLFFAFAVFTQVAHANQSPTIQGTPATTVAAGAAYSFSPTVRDPDGDRITCRLYGRPSWMTFDINTCRISGTVPQTATSGTVFADLRLEVGDGKLTASLPAFSIRVGSASSASSTASTLAIGGAPATSATVGTAYRFTPTLTNTTGKAASFSIANKPSWLTFSTSTGALTGTPGAGHVATHSGITITVTNGTTRAVLPAFSLQVRTAASAALAPPPAAGTASATTISWSPPTITTTGTSLSNLAGYRIYYGRSPDALTQSITISNPGATAHTMPELNTGTWYFGVRAFTANAVEGALSAILSKTIH